MKAVHRIRLSQADAHYGGGLIAGGRIMELFGDVATEICVRHDGDEGLLAGYSSVEFLAPVYAGDFLEVVGEIVTVGNSSREVSLSAYRYVRPRPDVNDSAADLLAEPEPVARATGTVVVKQDRRRPPT